MRDLLRTEYPGIRFDVVNLALDGYDSYQLLERLKSDGLGLSPDLVIVNSGINDVRNARFRFVNNKELYDIDNDPYEATNVIDQHPQVVKKMQAAYDRWWKETVPLMVNEATPNSSERPFFVLYEKQLNGAGIPAWKAPKL